MRSLVPEHRRIVRDAALLGRTVDPALLATITGSDAATMDAALHAAQEVTLLQPVELGLRFRHAMTRDALLADLSAHEHIARSRRALEALRRARPDLPGDLVDVAADLAEAADEPGADVELLLASARQALAGGALTSQRGAGAVPRRRGCAAGCGGGDGERAVR
jgi:hypothetical protein